jgi:hypothetical protein
MSWVDNIVEELIDIFREVVLNVLLGVIRYFYLFNIFIYFLKNILIG